MRESHVVSTNIYVRWFLFNVRCSDAIEPFAGSLHYNREDYINYIYISLFGLILLDLGYFYTSTSGSKMSDLSIHCHYAF
jgi:hypothetical protein